MNRGEGDRGADRGHRPRWHGYGVRFVGLPQLLCVNKSLSDSAVGLRAGSIGVVCITNYDANSTDASYLTLDWNWIKVYTPSGRLVPRAPMVTHR